jgi:hypothetical protein
MTCKYWALKDTVIKMPEEEDEQYAQGTWHWNEETWTWEWAEDQSEWYQKGNEEQDGVPGWRMEA